MFLREILKITRLFLVKLLLFMLGVLFYALAVVSTFAFEFYTSTINPLLIFIFTSVGGLGALALGYASVIILGGIVSLRLNEFIAHVTMCKQVVEVTIENPQTTFRRTWRDFLLYMPALVFALSLILAWDIHNVHDPQTSIFYPLLRTLDIFSKPIAADPLLRPIEVVLAMTVLIGIAGIAPSMALPYFRKFKITGVNSGPFHTNFLFLVVGLIVGLGTLLTLVGFIYSVLWVGKGPIIYHYVFLALLGLSLHYTLGAFLGRDKSEDIIMTKLRTGSRKRVVQGTVIIQGSRLDDKRKPS
jgi:hypothetical protein